MSAIQLMQKLKDDGIGIKRGIMAWHLEPFFAGDNKRNKLPVTENLIVNSFCIPLYAQMKISGQNFIVEMVD